MVLLCDIICITGREAEAFFPAFAGVGVSGDPLASLAAIGVRLSSWAGDDIAAGDDAAGAGDVAGSEGTSGGEDAARGEDTAGSEDAAADRGGTTPFLGGLLALRRCSSNIRVRFLRDDEVFSVCGGAGGPEVDERELRVFGAIVVNVWYWGWED